MEPSSTEGTSSRPGRPPLSTTSQTSSHPRQSCQIRRKQRDSGPGVCRRCTPDTPDSLQHSMAHCSFSAPAATALLACLNRIAPGSTHEAALNLEYDVDPDLELPVVTLLACSFLAIWTAHKDDRALTTARLKAALQVRVHTLQHTTKYQAAAEKLKIMLNYIT